MGRPKSVPVSIYLPVTELEIIEQAAKAAGHSRNQEIVARIRGFNVKPPINENPEVTR